MIVVAGHHVNIICVHVMLSDLSARPAALVEMTSGECCVETKGLERTRKAFRSLRAACGLGRDDTVTNNL